MSDIDELIKKRREERAARERARIERLREINLKKYPIKTEHVKNLHQMPSTSKESQVKNGAIKKDIANRQHVKNNFHVNGTTKRPITAPVTKAAQIKMNIKAPETEKTVTEKQSFKKVPTKINDIPVHTNNINNSESKIPITKPTTKNNEKTKTLNIGAIRKSILPLKTDKQPNRVISSTAKTQQMKELAEVTKKITVPSHVLNPTSRKSIAVSVPSKINPASFKPKTNIARKSMMPTLQEAKSESVFERLYKPKNVPKKTTSEVEKLKTDPNFLQNTLNKAQLILNKRHTMFSSIINDNAVSRRSLSAVHLKRISKHEAANCIHKWSSIGDKLDCPDLEVNEDDKVKGDKVTSAIKSERKKVKFMTPTASLNTPTPEELQARLKSWLQKRGKNLDSYHHLQCFGVHKAAFGTPKEIPMDKTLVNFDEENKENIALESDSDDGSYAEIMNEAKGAVGGGDKIDIYNWRRASIDSESAFNDTNNFNETTVTSAGTLTNVDELLFGALNDLSDLLREGFEWQQAARWLRAIRERYPRAPTTAAYWECRAALEDSRGDLPASLHCWEEAIAKGTEHSVVEANVDQLLEKFMQLKISPKSGNSREPDSKLVDVKNVFKSTIIRFAVQQAKLRRQSEQLSSPIATVTPVRRSARLSHRPPARTPLQLCDSVRHAATITKSFLFTPNKNFVETP